MTDIYEFLDANNVSYERHDHPEVFTVEESKKLSPELNGASTKNLFLRDKKGIRHFLVTVPEDKKVDLKALSSALDSSRLSFASPERLKTHLGIDPGSVSLLALANDSEIMWRLSLTRKFGKMKQFCVIRWSIPAPWWFLAKT